VPTVDLAALGAFLSGAGAVIGGIVSIRLVQRRAKKECDARVAEVMRTFKEGIQVGEDHE